MENTKFQFKGFIVKRSVIELKDGETGKKFNISINPYGKLIPPQSLFELILEVQVFDENKILNIELLVSADFYFDKKVEKTRLNNLFFVNAPAILFPYVRAYISTLTNLSGIKPINLPTLNLTQLADQLRENTKEVAEGSIKNK